MPDKALDDQAKRIDKALQIVEGKIMRLTGKLDTTADRLTTGDINLAAALELRNQIFSQFKPFLKETRKITNEFENAAILSQSRFKALGIEFTFTLADGDLIRAYSQDAYLEIEAIATRQATAIGTVIYEGAIAGTAIDTMTESIKQLLQGGTDKRGMPMAHHAKTIANTRYMEIDSLMTQRKGYDFGINKYKYYGSNISDTRDWCVKHSGKILTYKEIKAWEGKQWAGKKAGDPFIARGGWNCRHHFVPVLIDKE